MAEIKPMPYYEARQIAEKHKLIMKSIVDYNNEDIVYFQIEEKRIYFFTKTSTGEYCPIDEDIEDYLPRHKEAYYIPAGRAK